MGTATFTGSGSTATSTFATPVTLPKDTDATLTIKADLSAIGTSQAGTEGHLVVINYQGAKATGQSSGTTTYATGSTSVAGVRTFKSYPTISLDTLPSSGVADGRLIHFKVTANSAGPVGLAAFNFTIASSSLATGGGLSSFSLYGFTDSSYSQPIAGQGSGGIIDTTLASSSCVAAYNTANGSSCTEAAAGSPVTLVVKPAGTANIQVPAGSTYYFELRATVAGVQTGSSVSTTLLGDSAYPSLPVSTYVSNSTITGAKFIWSPNATTTAVANDNDWTNGYSLPGLPSGGLIQSRSN